MGKLRFTRSSVALVAALLTAGMPLGSAAPVAAEGERTVTLDPSTGLAPSQEVAITGAGFNPSVSVAIVQCRGAVPTIGDCDIGNFTTVTSDATGGFSATFVIRRLMSRGSSIVDCASAPGACVVVGVEMSDFSLLATAPLEFDADAPFPPSPPLAVTPPADLADKQIVAVGGSGFLPDEYYSLRQCVAGPAPETTCGINSGSAWTDAAGTLAGSFRVRRIIDGSGVSVDCATAVGTCELLAIPGPGPDFASRAPLAFDPDAPPAPPPVVEVQPSTGLADRQQVVVSGNGFQSFAWVQLQSCAVVGGAPTYPCRSYGSELETDADGSFSTPLPIRRVIFAGEGEGELVDCAVSPCALVARVYGDDVEEAAAAVSFDPDAPLPPPPTVAVDPDSGLADRQIVDISGGGWTPGSLVSLTQCGTDPDGVEHCDYATWREVPADGAGTLTAELRVRREIHYWYWDEESGDEGEMTLDCAAEPGRCFVRAYAWDDWSMPPTAPLTFDPAAPPAPLPAITVAPGTALLDRQEVAVEGSGFLSGEWLSMSQCAAPADPEAMPSPCRGGTEVWAEADGTLSTTFVVRRLTGGYGSDPVDCASAPQRCVILVGDPYSYDHSVAPISFDPDAPLPPRPTVRAVPEVGLVDGQTVEVHGNGFMPGAWIGMAQCLSGATSTAGCDIGRFQGADASDTGELSAPFVVRSTISVAGQTIDCAAEPGRCAIGAADMSDYVDANLAPLTFGDPPVVSAGAVSGTEGDAGDTTTVEVPLSLSGPSHAPVSVHYEVVAGTAQPGDDFVAAAGEAAFAPGETTTTVHVGIAGDVIDEDDETFQVVLSEPRHSTVGGEPGVVTIVDDDDPPAVVPMAGTVTEGHRKKGRVVEIPVVLTAPSSKAVTVEYRTVRFTAKKGSDFRGTRGVLTFAPGQTSAVVPVGIVGDRTKEPTELFLLRFSGATNATIGGFGGYGFGIILDDD